MVIYIHNYKICSNQFGYTVLKRKGKKQWNGIGYYNSLEQAFTGLFEYRVNNETANFIVDLNNAKKFESQKTDLLKKIKEIKDELLGGLQYGC